MGHPCLPSQSAQQQTDDACWWGASCAFLALGNQLAIFSRSGFFFLVSLCVLKQNFEIVTRSTSRKPIYIFSRGHLQVTREKPPWPSHRRPCTASSDQSALDATLDNSVGTQLASLSCCSSLQRMRGMTTGYHLQKLSTDTKTVGIHHTQSLLS